MLLLRSESSYRDCSPVVVGDCMVASSARGGFSYPARHERADRNPNHSNEVIVERAQLQSLSGAHIGGAVAEGSEGKPYPRSSSMSMASDWRRSWSHSSRGHPDKTLTTMVYGTVRVIGK